MTPIHRIEALILCLLFPRGAESPKGYERDSAIEDLLGTTLFSRVRGRTVIDFGCGTGSDAIALAERGARRVIGIDIRDDFLDLARTKAANAGVADICEFGRDIQIRADVIVSIDAFEHFADPAAILRTMDVLLADNGEVLISFGWTWYHPRGGHLFSVFPWAHLLFSEEALIAWRSQFKADGATKFREVAGGLNQMTIARFERIIAESPFKFAQLELVPIRPLRWLQPFAREFATATVRCRLVKR